MVERSNYPEFKSKIQNFLNERDKGKFDLKLITAMSTKAMELFEVNPEVMYEKLTAKDSD